MGGGFNMGRLDQLLRSADRYLEKAVQAREDFYAGMEAAALKALTEKQGNLGPTDAKYRFGKSLQGTQLINDNKWHMAQSRSFSLLAIATGVASLLFEQRRTNKLLEDLLKKR
jgi:hypothetical protein